MTEPILIAIYAYCYWLVSFAIGQYLGAWDNMYREGELGMVLVFFSPLLIPLALPILALVTPFILTVRHISTPAQRRAIAAERQRLMSEPIDSLEERLIIEEEEKELLIFIIRNINVHSLCTSSTRAAFSL